MKTLKRRIAQGLVLCIVPILLAAEKTLDFIAEHYPEPDDFEW